MSTVLALSINDSHIEDIEDIEDVYIFIHSHATIFSLETCLSTFSSTIAP